MKELEDLCKSVNMTAAESRKTPLNNFLVEDRNSLWETLQQLKPVIQTLAQDQKQYLRRACGRTIYGSESAPIGDDQYLLSMLAEHHVSE